MVKHAADQRRQPRRVEVLDDLHQDDGVVASEPVIPVGRRGLHELQARPLAVRHPVQVQPPGGDLQRPVRHVHPEHLRERRVRDEFSQQRPLPAAQVDDAGGALFPQGSDDRGGAELRQGGRPVLLLLSRPAAQDVGLGVVDLGQPAHRALHQAAVVTKVAAGDRRAFGVAGQPAATGAHELVDLVRAHPVVLAVVQDRHQHVQLGQRLRDRHRPGQAQVDVRRVAPRRQLLVQSDRRRAHRPAERSEKALDQIRVPPAREGRDVDLERHR